MRKFWKKWTFLEWSFVVWGACVIFVVVYLVTSPPPQRSLFEELGHQAGKVARSFQEGYHARDTTVTKPKLTP